MDTPTIAPAETWNWVYLASASPRRRELLAQIGVSYRLLAVEVDETPLERESPTELVRRLALAKARAGSLGLGGAGHPPVLAADTVVVLDTEILGKPRDRADGLAMLDKLSARHHQVFTGVALCRGGGPLESRVSCSRVGFRHIAPTEASAYWASGEPVDKAGAYAIQGLAAIFVNHLEGSYSGVMGLPLFETAQLLAMAGVPLLATDRGSNSGEVKYDE